MLHFPLPALSVISSKPPSQLYFFENIIEFWYFNKSSELYVWVWSYAIENQKYIIVSSSKYNVYFSSTNYQFPVAFNQEMRPGDHLTNLYGMFFSLGVIKVAIPATFMITITMTCTEDPEDIILQIFPSSGSNILHRCSSTMFPGLQSGGRINIFVLFRS